MADTTVAPVSEKVNYATLNPEELQKAQAALLAKVTPLIKQKNWNYIKFDNPFVFMDKKITFRKVDEKSAQHTIENEGNDSTQMSVMVPEALEFMIEELNAGRVSEVIDYRKYINTKVVEEGGHIELTVPLNYSGREYTVSAIVMPKDPRNGASITYTQKGGNQRTDSVVNMDEGLLGEISDVIKKNKFL